MNHQILFEVMINKVLGTEWTVSASPLKSLSMGFFLVGWLGFFLRILTEKKKCWFAYFTP